MDAAPDSDGASDRGPAVKDGPESLRRADATPTLELRGLEYRVGSFSLSVPRLDLYRGEYLCVVGPTGSGKTTMLELIAGIRRAKAGTVRYRGSDVTRAAPEERFMGFAYQDSLLLPFLDVEDNILFGARSGGRRLTPEVERRAGALMERMGIGELQNRRPVGLSGGERQRVSLARSLLLRPPLLLLDEPLSALDEERRRSIRALLKEYQEAEGITVVHVTHDREEVDALATAVAVMDDGRLSEKRPPISGVCSSSRPDN